MTVGEFKGEEDLTKALEEIRKQEYEFTTIVKKVSVEIIDENEDSIIEMERKLK